MSQRPCQTLEDLRGHSGCMVARCKPCDRAVIFTIQGMIEHCGKYRAGTNVRALMKRMKCKRCGRRAYSFGFRQGARPAIADGSVEVNAPAGIDPVEWYMAGSDDERRRMVRRVRG